MPTTFALERAKKVIAGVPKQHPFNLRYHRVERVNWETCERVIASNDELKLLREGW